MKLILKHAGASHEATMLSGWCEKAEAAGRDGYLYAVPGARHLRIQVVDEITVHLDDKVEIDGREWRVTAIAPDNELSLSDDRLPDMRKLATLASRGGLARILE